MELVRTAYQGRKMGPGRCMPGARTNPGICGFPSFIPNAFACHSTTHCGHSYRTGTSSNTFELSNRSEPFPGGVRRIADTPGESRTSTGFAVHPCIHGGWEWVGLNGWYISRVKLVADLEVCATWLGPSGRSSSRQIASREDDAGREPRESASPQQHDHIAPGPDAANQDCHWPVVV